MPFVIIYRPLWNLKIEELERLNYTNTIIYRPLWNLKLFTNWGQEDTVMIIYRPLWNLKEDRASRQSASIRLFIDHCGI